MSRLAVLVCIAALAGCLQNASDVNDAFTDGPTQLHCGLNLDSEASNSIDSIDTGLDRAAQRGEVIDLYAHGPGVTVPLAKIERVLSDARARGLAFLTYEDLAAGKATGPALVLSFDDTWVDQWLAMQPLLDQYGAHVTFFVTRYVLLDAKQHAELHQLADAGNAIEAHTVNHLRGPDYVRDHGLDAYMTDEILPSITVLRDEGYRVNALAYPFGAHTSEIDRRILKHVALVRSVTFAARDLPTPCH